MSTATLKERAAMIAAEIAAAVTSTDEAALRDLVERIVSARRVFLTAQGRSGWMLKSVGIRLMHIGIDIRVPGEVSTPAIGAGDLLIAASASGKTAASLGHLAVARKVGATTALITAVEGMDDAADVIVSIPIRSSVSTQQHAGSLFEQTVLVVGDSLAWMVQRRLDVSDAAMNARHANLQ